MALQILTDRTNNALSFRGVNASVDIGNTATFNITGALSFEFWAKQPTSSAARQLIYRLDSTNGYQFDSNAGTLRFVYRSSTAVKVTETTETWHDDRWHHVAVTYNASDSNRVILYVDGVALKNQTNVGAMTGTASLNCFIGNLSSGGSTNNWAGDMCEVRIWNTTRTVVEITANMYKRVLGNETGLVAYFPMDEGTGTTITDRSTNSNNGTAVGSPTWINGAPIQGSGAILIN